ncbi:flagellar filament capping protein FliD [Magnetospirillum molischianum]|uniref:Flagellar capping protein n=1 Tax=Magnetospirillum molischianum DSM 120 TaxID=1150626 RepID=H8FRX2_MAGML|nr:flagellar filament capping protein FliD [Magnetospirillum molischianum]CCG41110.1 Flagellar capping protein [Magnetospirillum molischianum DSM 120]
MSTTGTAALPSSLATLLNKYGNTTAESQPHRAAKPAGERLGADPAFTLSLGIQDTGSALVGYNRLAQIGDKFETEVAKLETPSEAQGTALTVTVSQLAQAQSISTSPIGTPDKASLGTGTLTIQTGTLNADTNAFTASTIPAVSIPITGGSLNEIASAVNAAKAGVTASVVEEGGGYSLHLTSTATGASNAFRISGLSDLTYDPSAPNASQMVTGAEAKDAVFSIDGKDYTSASNTNVPVAIGARTDFTVTGTQTVQTSNTADQVQSLANTFNAMQKAIITLTSKGGGLEADANLAAGLFKNLGDAATATVDTTGTFKSLADIGVTLQSDGTLKIDPTKLDAAIRTDAGGVQSLVNQIASTIDDAIKPYTGSSGSLKSQVTLLGTLATRGGPSLLDYLNGNAPSQTQSTTQGGLAALLNGGNAASGTATQNTLASYLSNNDPSVTPDLSALFK